MGRILSDKVKNSLKILDSVSGDVLTLYFRIPTTAERVQFESDQYTVENGVVVNSRVKARQKWGVELFQGFKKGDFKTLLEDGSLKEFSSDPDDPDYREDWKELVEKQAIDLLEALASHLFEGHRVIPMQTNAQGERKN